jgi:hypothetical protein
MLWILIFVQIMDELKLDECCILDFRGRVIYKGRTAILYSELHQLFESERQKGYLERHKKYEVPGIQSTIGTER